MTNKINHEMKLKVYTNLIIIFLGVLAISCAIPSTQDQAEDYIIGDAPAINIHVNQEDINNGNLSLEELIKKGELLFKASFNTLDGAGRPEAADVDRRNNVSINNRRPRHEFPDNFNRISGPDANSCLDCHGIPRMGGGDSNATNVFVLADRIAFANFDGKQGDNNENHTLKTIGNERTSIGLFGSGWIELIAREMTTDLKSQAEKAINEAKSKNANISKHLVTKGVSFGTIIARPDATIDFSALEGIDKDLVIRPFQQKGTIVSLREFGVKAMNSHFGMQPSEQFRDGIDFDKDGYSDELTRGDLTALVAFQATLPVPGTILPNNDKAKKAVNKGRVLFQDIGCVSCHIPELRVDNPVFTEPSPFNPRGKLQPTDVNNPLKIDLTKEGAGPHLKREADGSVLVPAFTDLKRHKMGPLLNNEVVIEAGVPTDEWITRKLWGFASEPPFLHHGRATLISEAILAHGGEAKLARDRFDNLPGTQKSEIVEFLKTLQVMPESNQTPQSNTHKASTDIGFIALAGGLIGLIIILLTSSIIILIRRITG